MLFQVTDGSNTRFLDFLTLASALLVAYAVYAVAVFLRNAFLHPLSKFPGPISHAGSPIPAWWALWNGRDHSHKKDLHDKYGSVVRVAPDELSYNNANGWRDIYGHVQGRKQIPKDVYFYLPENIHAPRSLINADDEDHTRIRRLVSHAFSATALKEQEKILNKYFELLIQRLKEQIASPAEGKVDLTAWYNYTTWDIIGDLAMGDSFGMLSTAGPPAFMTRLTKGSQTLMYLWTGHLFPPFGFLLRCYSKLPFGSNARSQQVAFAKECVAKRLSTDTDRKDFMSYILRYNDERGMTKQEIDMTSKTLINAGSETTATALPGATYHLLTHPSALEKATQEVRSRFKTAGEISLQTTSQKDLPYLFACIEEALRNYPPISFAFPRRTLTATEIDGAVVPAGTRVGVHQYAAYHSSSNFLEPDEFIPERWMGDERFKADKRDAFNRFPPGRGIVWARKLLSILSRMLFHFDMKLCKESANWLPQRSLVMWERPPLMVELKVAG